MPRKSADLDKKMIQAGLELIQVNGISSLSIRDVTGRAGANLGMFNYYFGTREEFVKRLLNEFYNDFLAKLENQQNASPDLEAALMEIAIFTRDRRQILTTILSDVLANEETVTQFLKKNFSRHFVTLKDVLSEHAATRKLAVSNPNHAIRFLLGAVGVPNILLEVYNRNSKKKVRQESDLELRARAKAAIIGLEAQFCEHL